MDKQKFTILWIDDNPDSVKKIKNEIKDKIEKDYPDLELEIISGTTRHDAITELKDNNIEILITDYNLGESENGSETGLDVLKEVRKNNSAIDVLFYTVKTFGTSKKDTSSIEEEARKLDYVKIVNGRKEIVYELPKLIEDHLKRFNDIVFLRGIVISNAIALELRINEFLVKYFRVPKETEDNFHNFVMESGALDFYNKRRTIEKIFYIGGNWANEIKPEFSGLIPKEELKSLIQKLRNIEEQRNQLAHCKLSKTKINTLVQEGRQIEFDRKKVNTLLDEIREAYKKIDNIKDNINTAIEKEKKDNPSALSKK